MIALLQRINYMKYAKRWIAMSIALTLVGFVAIGLQGGPKLGIDFTGGNYFDISFEQKVDIAQVRAAVEKVDSGASIQQATGTDDFVIRTKELKEQRADFLKGLESAGKYHITREDQVSGSVSSELAWTCGLAVAIAGILQILYLALRFQYRFGITAVVALLHDLVITIGLVSIFRVQINAPFVAAILTILGYSINDTVIVFDRIREDLKSRKKTESLVDLTTRAIQETMNRSIYTVVAVQITIVALIIWGGASINDMVITLFIGLTSGMYSSIFIAAALWVFWEQRVERMQPKVGAGKTVKA